MCTFSNSFLHLQLQLVIFLVVVFASIKIVQIVKPFYLHHFSTPNLHHGKIHSHVWRHQVEISLLVLELLNRNSSEELGSMRLKVGKVLRAIAKISWIFDVIRILFGLPRLDDSFRSISMVVRIDHTHIGPLVVGIKDLQYVFANELVVSV
jgi:hypothetical protein